MISANNIGQIGPPGQYHDSYSHNSTDKNGINKGLEKQIQTEPTADASILDNDNISETKDMLNALKKDIEMIRNLGVQFSVDEETGDTVIKIVDKETKDIIREIPPEQVLKLREKLDEMVGMLFDQRV